MTHNSTQIDSAEVTWRIIISDNTLVWSPNVERNSVVSKCLCFSQTCFHNNFSNVSSFYDLVKQNNENASWKKFSWLFTSFTTRNWNRTHCRLQFKVSNIQVRDSGSLLLFDIQNYCLNDSLFSLLRICLPACKYSIFLDEIETNHSSFSGSALGSLQSLAFSLPWSVLL